MNMDLALRVDALPVAGQTVLSHRRQDGPGGKGLNQAVASARAGAVTRFVGAAGDDAEGAALRQVLADDGIEPLVRTSAARTGLAVVLLDAAGENSIVVAPGANAELVDLTARELAAVSAARVLLMQLEVPLPTVAAAQRAARDAGTSVVLNAAPASTVDDLPLDGVDVLVVNEGEARTLSGATSDLGVERLLGLVPAVVMTLGPVGAVYADREGVRLHAPGLPVEVTDTTGAGDTFAGYLAAALAGDADMTTALARANSAAALCVQRRGAVPAVPHSHEVESLLTQT